MSAPASDVSSEVMTATTLQLFFNYRSPYCYLASKSMFSVLDDYDVTLDVSDPSGNWGIPSSIAFTIDTVAPTVEILVLPEDWVFPKFYPFQDFFSAHDDDGASGQVVHEWILVDDCIVYDGFEFGNGVQLHNATDWTVGF